MLYYDNLVYNVQHHYSESRCSRFSIALSVRNSYCACASYASILTYLYNRLNCLCENAIIIYDVHIFRVYTCAYIRWHRRVYYIIIIILRDSRETYYLALMQKSWLILRRRKIVVRLIYCFCSLDNVEIYVREHCRVRRRRSNPRRRENGTVRRSPIVATFCKFIASYFIA